MMNEASTSKRRPSWVTYIISRDEAAGEEIIVEEWAGSPPFGYMAGVRDIESRTVDYFGHTYPTAADCITSLEDVPESIQAELIYYARSGEDMELREVVQCASKFPIYDREITSDLGDDEYEN